MKSMKGKNINPNPLGPKVMGKIIGGTVPSIDIRTKNFHIELVKGHHNLYIASIRNNEESVLWESKYVPAKRAITSLKLKLLALSSELEAIDMSIAMPHELLGKAPPTPTSGRELLRALGMAPKPAGKRSAKRPS